MPEQVRKHQTTEKQKSEAAAETTAALEAKARTAEQQALLDDDILDEIDAALEGLDQELAVQFRQAGGE